MLVVGHKGTVVNVGLPSKVGIRELRGYPARKGIYGGRLGGSGAHWVGAGGLGGSGVHWVGVGGLGGLKVHWLGVGGLGGSGLFSGIHGGLGRGRYKGVVGSRLNSARDCCTGVRR